MELLNETIGGIHYIERRLSFWERIISLPRVFLNWREICGGCWPLWRLNIVLRQVQTYWKEETEIVKIDAN